MNHTRAPASSAPPIVRTSGSGRKLSAVDAWDADTVTCPDGVALGLGFELATGAAVAEVPAEAVAGVVTAGAASTGDSPAG